MTALRPNWDSLRRITYGNAAPIDHAWSVNTDQPLSRLTGWIINADLAIYHQSPGSPTEFAKQSDCALKFMSSPPLAAVITKTR